MRANGQKHVLHRTNEELAEVLVVLLWLNLWYVF